MVLLQKELADMKLETFHSVYVTAEQDMQVETVVVDYHLGENGGRNWNIVMCGGIGEGMDLETWTGSPGNNKSLFRKYNTILFGNSLFDVNQMKFHSVSKNKEMFDIIDLDEVGGCYYGLFKDLTNSSEDGQVYVVFKTFPEGEQESIPVQRLPYRISVPKMYRTLDDLYSIYVVEDNSVLREVSVPDSDMFSNRVIDLDGILRKHGKIPDGVELEIRQAILSRFKVGDSRTSFFVLSNLGLHKIEYQNTFEQVSIDRMQGRLDGKPIGLKDVLLDSLKSTVVAKHVSDMHHGEQSSYFDAISGKMNQFHDDFDIFQTIPTEFTETQDIGVVPDQKVDDTDEETDHRVDSIQVSTDVLLADGMPVNSDENPGIVVCAVSNPATVYDSGYVFLKSQRNPLIEGTEFYDFIVNEGGDVLMDLYQIPFIYQVKSNNTYDLWINVPTTRTKYLNRVSGTLTYDGTTQVLKDDAKTRRNFLDESLPNNLDESTTRLRVYIDRKYISVGNIELVEISGNSIPLQIYRDSNANDGLYDSIALESRWNGEVVEINEPSKDINKVMLEFECYGTDSQSIHIQGKTLIHHSLDDRKYKFA